MEQDKEQRDDQAPIVSRAEELLRKPRYSPQEAAEVLQLRERTINSAVYGGELKGYVVNGDIVSIERGDLIDWLRRRL